MAFLGSVVKLFQDSSTRIKIFIVIGLGLVGFSSRWIKNSSKKKGETPSSSSKKEGETPSFPSKKEGETPSSPSKNQGENKEDISSPSKREPENKEDVFSPSKNNGGETSSTLENGESNNL